MTVDTIKNVLIRILSINKNMSEESLDNLLVASGWDQSDIKEGINIYRAYKSNDDNTDSISEYRPIKLVNSDSQTNGNGFFGNKIETGKLEEVQKEVTLQQGVAADKVATNIVSLLDNSTEKEIENKIEEIEIIKENTLQNINNSKVLDTGSELNLENKNIVERLKTENVNLISHESHIDTGELDQLRGREKPYLIIIVDIILFVITLVLLGYILLY